MNTKTLIVGFLTISFLNAKSQIVSPVKAANTFQLTDVTIYVDPGDDLLVKKSAELFQHDIEMVTGIKPSLINEIPKKASCLIVIGSIEKSSLLKKLIAGKKINAGNIKGKWETFQLQTLTGILPNIKNTLVIAGSDRRGTAYGVFEISKQMGVSPWYWWADVPVKKQSDLYIKLNTLLTDGPKVKYRGIFINDEAPALSGWSKEKFGGFNHLFYEKVFELIIRLKGNYHWPAMWGNAFYDDDSLNIKVADEYGIVIGTSHHEPLMRAHDEWRRYGNKKKWDYDSTTAGLQEFWREGMQRAWNEKIVSVGMRGDGDAPMSRETATALLERIVKDQRKIIEDVTKKPASQTPQLWALYKEVQDYYDKGMRVPDDVTLLLCDDNWGNIRKLPKLSDPSRKGGYGIYYHFDYVGGPRNYKWLNTNPIPRVWEQMHLAYEYGVKEIWIVNVGDIKPMEFPISFFLDYAWNPDRIGADDIQKYTEQWAAAQFGSNYSKEIAHLLSFYAKYNGRRKPELLDANTYSFNYNEWPNVVKDYNLLLEKAEKINDKLDQEYKDAYFQLILHPIAACANLNEMYYNVALNKLAFQNKSDAANKYAEKVKALYEKDSLITLQYHQLKDGKWNHMMDQTHIGYTYWQQPPRQRMPQIQTLTSEAIVKQDQNTLRDVWVTKNPEPVSNNSFYEIEDAGVSIEASHYTKAINSNNITWKVLPDLGRTLDAVASFPVTASIQKPGGGSPHLQYEINTASKDSFNINAYFSPTLNYYNTDEGLQYAISIDDETPQIVSINKEDRNTGAGIWNKWAGENIIIKTSKHFISKPGKHTVKYWMVNPGVVLQKIVIDFGRTAPSYLGPPETRNTIISSEKSKSEIK